MEISLMMKEICEELGPELALTVMCCCFFIITKQRSPSQHPVKERMPEPNQMRLISNVSVPVAN